VQTVGGEAEPQSLGAHPGEECAGAGEGGAP
jgi:hypothetical protein